MTLPPLHILLVFVGGGTGSVLRYVVTLWSIRLYGPHFPWGTMAINIAGSTIMGIVAAFVIWRGPGSGSDAIRLFFMTGVLGGFTTFSAFSLDTMVLWERGEGLLALAYVLLSVAISLAAIATSMGVTHAILAAAEG